MKGVASRLRGLAALLFLLPLCQCNDGLLGGARKMMSGHAGHHGAAAVDGEQEPMVHASPDDVFVHAERRALTGANYSDIEDDLSKACRLSKTDATRTSIGLIFTPLPLSSASNGTVCRVNPTLVRGYFLPYRTSQFLLAVRRALTSTANTNLCAVFVSRFDWQCAIRRKLSSGGVASGGRRSHRSRKTARKTMGGIEGLGTTVPEASHQQQQTAGRRKLAPGDSARYEAYVTLYSSNVASLLDTAKLTANIKADMAGLLRDYYGSSYACNYDVTVDLGATPPLRNTSTYNMPLSLNTLFPDGYPFTGTFYGNGADYQGPVVNVVENDIVEANVINNGNLPQATHWHGMNVEQYPFNDGAVGTSQGTLHVGASYKYIFNAFPAGTTWYHGHIQHALADGNRGFIVVHKDPCHDPYLNAYDEDRLLMLTEAMPWAKDGDSLRHISGAEDFNAFMNGIFADDYVGTTYDLSVTTDAETLPVAQQPWAGALLNGVGRATPIDWNKDGPRLGNNSGNYSIVNVEQGKKYRLRILCAASEWGYRVTIDNHTMPIISVLGNDIEPYNAPEFGIELQPGERYDVLLTADQAPNSKHLIKITSIDGCYKSAAWLLYDGETLTDDDIALADDYQADRVCDADCYDGGPCVPTKAFNVDSYFDKVVSVEEDAVPPPNPTGSYAKLIIQAEGTLEFVMNSIHIGTVEPPLYSLHEYDPSFATVNPRLSLSVSKYSFQKGEVVDWCTVGYTPDRHPMHMHGARFWVLGAGRGSECKNMIGEGNPAVKVDVVNIDFATTPLDPHWVLFRTRIDENGAFPYHCHLAYHQYKGLLVPVISGKDEAWREAPEDLPLGRSISN